MARSIFVLLAAFLVFADLRLVAQDPPHPTPASPDEQALPSGGELAELAQLSSEQLKQLADLRRQVAATKCPGKFQDKPIAFSVWGWNHRTAGQNVLLEYPNTITNEGGAWIRNSTMVALCDGLYFFSIEFVKDPYKNEGTKNDVNLGLYKNGQWVGQALAGKAEGKETGAYSVILRLQQNDLVQTYIHTDDGSMRNLGYYNFTGHRISN